MSTTSLTAAEVMDKVAALMNDPAKTDYTYVAVLPYLNMAIDELVESLEESNSSPTNQTSIILPLAVGKNKITPIEHVEDPHYPFDLVEIQEVLERLQGTNDPFVPLGRRDFIDATPIQSALRVWAWEDQIIKFNEAGVNSPRDVQIRYVRQAITNAQTEDSIIGTINSKSYLYYKTAALCALFIGENETRAGVLDGQAEKALERVTTINNKGRQSIITRHRPFRASYKARGGY